MTSPMPRSGGIPGGEPPSTTASAVLSGKSRAADTRETELGIRQEERREGQFCARRCRSARPAASREARAGAVRLRSFLGGPPRGW
jgi:hypothetical protein